MEISEKWLMENTVSVEENVENIQEGIPTIWF